MTDLFKGENLAKTAMLIAGYYILFVLLISQISSIDTAIAALTGNIILILTIVAGFYVIDNFLGEKFSLTKKQNVLLGGTLGSFMFLIFITGFDLTFILDLLLKSIAYGFLALGVYTLVSGGEK